MFFYAHRTYYRFPPTLTCFLAVGETENPSARDFMEHRISLKFNQ